MQTGLINDRYLQSALAIEASDAREKSRKTVIVAVLETSASQIFRYVSWNAQPRNAGEAEIATNDAQRMEMKRDNAWLQRWPRLVAVRAKREKCCSESVLSRATAEVKCGRRNMQAKRDREVTKVLPTCTYSRIGFPDEVARTMLAVGHGRESLCPPRAAHAASTTEYSMPRCCR